MTSPLPTPSQSPDTAGPTTQLPLRRRARSQTPSSLHVPRQGSNVEWFSSPSSQGTGADALQACDVAQVCNWQEMICCFFYLNICINSVQGGPGSDAVEQRRLQQPPKTKRTRQRPPYICKRCGQEGHKEATCRNPPPRRGARLRSQTPADSEPREGTAVSMDPGPPGSQGVRQVCICLNDVFASFL
jgi:hypothetical protein